MLTSQQINTAYIAAGYKSREDYIKTISRDFDIPLAEVEHAASKYEPCLRFKNFQRWAMDYNYCFVRNKVIV